MRKLMWFTIGFTAACALGVYLVSGNWLLLLAVCSLVCALAVYLVKSKWGRIAMLTLLGCGIGFLWLWGYDWLYLSDARAYDGKTIETTIEASDYSCETAYGVAAEGKLELEGKSYHVRFYLNEGQTLSPGDQVTGSFRLRFTVKGEQKDSYYYPSEGVFLLAYSTDEAGVVHGEKVPAQYFAASLRQKIFHLLNQVFPEDTAGFARALLLGDTSRLTYAQDTALQTSGIRHVVAVSGLHVSILFSLVYMASGKRRGLTAAVGIPVLVIFAAVAGLSPSIIRACIMQILMLLALLLNKEYDPPTALAFAVLAMLAGNPMTVTSVSFQLSVGCMVGIFLFSGKINQFLLKEKWLGTAKGKTVKARLKRWIAGTVSVTLSSMVTTTPLCAVYFGTVSLVGILTNLLTLWVVSFIFYGIMASCALGAVFLPAGKAVGWLVSWLIRYVLGAARLLSAFPFAAVYTCSTYTVVWLVFCYVLLAVFLLGKGKHPALFAGCLAVSLCVAVAAAWIEPLLPVFRLTVVDVGQGQCLLLQTGDRCYVVDCGGDSGENAADQAARLLLSQGITHIDALILTHYDEDHVGGAEYLLSRVPADTLYLPDTLDESGVREALSDVYTDRIVWVEPDTVTSIEEGLITIYAAAEGQTDNESSLCVLFQPGNYDILITGDRTTAGEAALLEQAALPELEILVAGHHGAGSSTGMELLGATTPAVVAISAGENNIYGHPNQETLDRLELLGCLVYRTDQEGHILLRGW